MTLKIYHYFYVAVLITGITGNVIGFIVCSQKKLGKTVFATYFRFLIFIDTCTLICSPLWFLNTEEFDFNLSLISNDFCKLSKIIQYMPATSCWIMVVISLNRLIIINFPTRFIFHKKRWFQIVVCFGLLIKDFLIYSQLYFQQVVYEYVYADSGEMNEATNEAVHSLIGCLITDIKGPQILSWIDLLNANVLPFFLVLVCTCLILKHLIQSRRNVSSCGNQQERIKRDRKFAFNAIGINIIFVLFTLPQAIFSLYANYFIDSSLQNYFVTIHFFLVLYLANFGSSFYINVWVNSIFRDEFKALVFCRQSNNPPDLV
jgi:hypothetical protein